MKLLLFLALLAPLTASAQCGPTGMDPVCGAGRRAMNQPIFADDATTVVHFTGWDYVGGTLTPKTGLPWTTVGTVPSSTGIGRVTKGIGPFDDSDYLKLGTGTDALDFVGHSSWAIAVLLKVPPHANQPVYLSDGQAGVAGWYAQLDAANQCVLAITGTGGTAGVYGGGSDPLSNGLQECCFGISGATAYARRGLNATVTGDISTTNYTPATSLPAELGRYNAATSFGFGGNVVELIASATADPASWCAARGHDVVARSGVRFVAAHGDSITYGWLVGPSRLTTPYPLALGNALGPGWGAMNDGVAGTITSQILINWETNTQGQGYSWVAVMGGINDVNTDLPATTPEANLATLYAGVVADHATPILMTVMGDHASIYYSSAREAQRQLLNAWIRATAAANGYPLIDAAAIYDQAGDDTYLDPAWDSGDGLHPNQAWADDIALRVKAVISP